jgi:hypothetical protein
MLTIEEKKKRNAKYSRKYRQNNKEAIAEANKKYYHKNKEHLKESMKEYRQNSKETVKEYWKEYYQKNKEAIAEASKKYYQKNKERMAEYCKEYRKNKYSTNLDYKFRHLLRSALYRNLKRYLIKETNPEFSYTKASSSLLGCTVEELKTHIENQFEDGMTWENWAHDGWHLDHIIPCSSFDLTKKKEQKKCFHYTNLQPLWAEDNLSKSSKLNWNKKELVV